MTRSAWKLDVLFSRTHLQRGSRDAPLLLGCSGERLPLRRDIVLRCGAHRASDRHDRRALRRFWRAVPTGGGGAVEWQRRGCYGFGRFGEKIANACEHQRTHRITLRFLERLEILPLFEPTTVPLSNMRTVWSSGQSSPNAGPLLVRRSSPCPHWLVLLLEGCWSNNVRKSWQQQSVWLEDRR